MSGHPILDMPWSIVMKGDHNESPAPDERYPTRAAAEQRIGELSEETVGLQGKLEAVQEQK